MNPQPPAAADLAPMFHPLALRGVTLPNRVVVSPMCMYAAADGTANDFHLVHLGSRALGGAGLVMTEMTNVSPEGRISPLCAGLYKPEHAPAWRRVTEFVHARSESKIGIQLGHAGRKAATPPPWQRGAGALGPDVWPWPLFAPSAVPFAAGGPMPKAMDRADMDKVRDDFVRAARWADEAGFDLVELHMGHGYLLSSFLSPLANRRNDEYGGPLENRLRFPLEVCRAVRAVWPDAKPLAARISAVDWEDGGNTIDDGVAIARALQRAGLDLIDVSSGNVTSAKRPATPGLFQTPYAALIRAETGLATMTVGNIRKPDDVNRVIADGQADLCAIGRQFLLDAYFVRHGAAGDGAAAGPIWRTHYKRASEV